MRYVARMSDSLSILATCTSQGNALIQILDILHIAALKKSWIAGRNIDDLSSVNSFKFAAVSSACCCVSAYRFIHLFHATSIFGYGERR